MENQTTAVWAENQDESAAWKTQSKRVIPGPHGLFVQECPAIPALFASGSLFT
jgi:hypothetical protein